MLIGRTLANDQEFRVSVKSLFSEDAEQKVLIWRRIREAYSRTQKQTDDNGENLNRFMSANEYVSELYLYCSNFLLWVILFWRESCSRIFS